MYTDEYTGGLTVYKAAKQYIKQLSQLDIIQTAPSASVVMPFCYVTLDAAGG